MQGTLGEGVSRLSSRKEAKSIKSNKGKSGGVKLHGVFLGVSSLVPGADNEEVGGTRFEANQLGGKLSDDDLVGGGEVLAARDSGHDLDDCFAFSDSYSDLPMLSVVGHPAAVNPDARLRLLAKAYSWPTLNLSKAS